MIAGAAMALSSVAVVTNSLRLRRFRTGLALVSTTHDFGNNKRADCITFVHFPFRVDGPLGHRRSLASRRQQDHPARALRA